MLRMDGLILPGTDDFMRGPARSAGGSFAGAVFSFTMRRAPRRPAAEVARAGQDETVHPDHASNRPSCIAAQHRCEGLS